jgi:hypothetical protein
LCVGGIKSHAFAKPLRVGSVAPAGRHHAFTRM